MSELGEGTGLGHGEVSLRIRTAEVPLVMLHRRERVYVRGERIPLAELEVTVLGKGSDSVSVLAGLNREQLTELVKRGQQILAGEKGDAP